MKIQILIFTLFTLLSFNLSAQCDDCGRPGPIENNGGGFFMAGNSAQAHFWEICDGPGIISGSNTGESVRVVCSGEAHRDITLRLTSFENGECTSNCITFQCGIANPPEPVCPDCLDFTDCLVYGTEGCETSYIGFDEDCLNTACFGGFRGLEIKLGGNTTFFPNIPPFGGVHTWDIPLNQNWDNFNICFKAFIIVDGEECSVSNCINLECDGRPQTLRNDSQSNQDSIDPSIQQMESLINVYPNLLNINQSANINVYPNPLNPNQSVNIDLSDTGEVIKDVQIFDVNGKVVIKEKSGKSTLSNLNLNSGLYFIQVSTNRSSYSSEIIIN